MGEKGLGRDSDRETSSKPLIHEISTRREKNMFDVKLE